MPHRHASSSCLIVMPHRRASSSCLIAPSQCAESPPTKSPRLHPSPPIHSTALPIAATKVYRLQQPPVSAIAESPGSGLIGRKGRERGDSQALSGLRCEESSLGRLRQLESTELCGLLLLGDGPANVGTRAQREVHEKGSLGGSSTRATAEDVNKGEAGRKQKKGGEVQATSKQLEMLQQANDEVGAVVGAAVGELASTPSLKGQVLVGRGSCHSALGQFDKALADLSSALATNPTSTAAFMARAGTYFKMNKNVEAIVDYSRVIDLDPSNAEAVRWRGILSFNLKYYYAAEKDFQQAIQLDPSLPFVFKGLGLAIGGSGRWRESLPVFAEGVRRHPQDADLWHSKGRAHKEVGEVANALEALQRALQIRKAVATYQELVSVSRFVGDYRAAIRYAREGLQLDRGDMELVHAHASSLHALGDLAEAMRKYQAALAMQPRDQEGQALQHSMFYQACSTRHREVLAYTIARLQQPLPSIRFDWDFTAEFREAWTKKDPIATLPGYQPLSVTARQSQRATLQSLPTLSREALDLIEAADRIGQRAHYHCDAFMANRQQLRMAGLAALDVMQQVRFFPFFSTLALLSSAPIHFDGVQFTRTSPGLAALDVTQQARATWDAMAKEQQGRGESAAGDTVPDTTTTMETDAPGGGGEGGGGSVGIESRAKQSQRGSDSSGKGSRKSSSGGKGSGGGVLKGWRDVYEVITRWRQISDPTDAVLWKDQLKNRFAQGFRSSTPIKVWDLQTVKYYPVFNKSFEAMREALLESEQAFTNNQPFSVPRNTRGDMITRAADLQALHQAVGKDFLVQAPCYSHAVPGKDLTGSMFEILKSTHAFSFYTHTPVSPQRWHDFDQELTAAWQALCAAVLDAHTEAVDPHRYRQRIQDAILRLGYFWFQLMPLTRGSAMVGLVSILGLSMAADMQTTTLIPHGVQVGWDVLLL
ncbi:unnamed protein product [Closterium sp. Naga37s-1]|nr:unnamed protein product [Closterium sp. Naga37s-1]